jgi:C4-dicarboxylate transporter/malic acid transport protein
VGTVRRSVACAWRGAGTYVVVSPAIPRSNSSNSFALLYEVYSKSSEDVLRWEPWKTRERRHTERYFPNPSLAPHVPDHLGKMSRNNQHPIIGRLPTNDSFPPFHDIQRPASRASTAASALSAEERLQWRSHPNVATPYADPRTQNPFEDPNLAIASPQLSRYDDRAHAHEDLSHDVQKQIRQEEVEEVYHGPEHERIDSNPTEKSHDPNHADPRTCTIVASRDSTRRSIQDVQQPDVHERRQNLSFKERIRHFTWTWFCLTMATGGIANVLYTVPFRFRGLYALGCIFFILNIVLFLFNIAMISCRFYFYPRTFKASFLHPTESLFIPAAVVSFGIILINISQYGVDMADVGEWLERCMIVLFWMDCGLAVCFSIGIYLLMYVRLRSIYYQYTNRNRWSTTTFTISQMTPIWIFPAYPLLIIGPHAGNLAPKVEDPAISLTIILTGYVIQGIGFLVSLMIYAAFIYRLMTQKLPKESLRPGMFISVGPSGFTIAGVIMMGQELPQTVPSDFMGEGNGELAGKVGMICANYLGLWLWGLALWFFFVSVGAHWSCARRGKMDFAMTWYSFIFPNTALTTATFAIARALNGNRPIQYIGCAMTIALICMWFFVVYMNIRAVVIRQILWPEKQEDRTEGGWKQQSAEEQQRRQREKELADGGESLRGRAWSRARTIRRRTGLGGEQEEMAQGPVLERSQTDGGARRKRQWSFVGR